MSTQQLLRLVSKELKVGTALPFAVRDEHGKLLLARGQVIYSPHQLEVLLTRGLYADQEEVKAWREGRPPPVDTSQNRLTLFDLWDQALHRLEKLHKSIGEPGFPQRCDEFVSQCIDLVQRDIDVAIFLAVRQDKKRLPLYGFTHSLHTALVCQLMSHRVGWTPDVTLVLVKAALTMNLPITEVQGRIAAIGRVTEGQREQLRTHPTRAVELLRAAGVTDAAWLQAIEQHHERVGGGGYPTGTTEVSELAAALRMADVFMARITARADRPAMSAQDAARQMFAETRGHPAAAAIIKEFGIYPPGKVVQLASGEMAVVVRRGSTAHAPVVATFTDKAGMPVVSIQRRDTSLPAYAIKGLRTDASQAELLPPERLFAAVG
ncbi:MAG: phosphohydrolase [Burkholderiales bacterium]|nr:phosphohydrolase [Burkholderiales bacterium]